MRTGYWTLAGGAILLGLALLTLQILGGLEYTDGATTYTQASMVAAIMTVAVLPIFIDAAWRTSKSLAVCLGVGFLAFLTYSLPASIGRIGEVKGAKAMAAEDAAALKRQLADVRKTLRFAEPDMEQECAGAPTPLPPRGWPECRRKRGSVTAFLNQRQRLEMALGAMGSARLGDTSSRLLAWVLEPMGITEVAIRRGTGMALAIGLEVVIFSLFGLAVVAIRKGSGLPSNRYMAHLLEGESTLPLTSPEVPLIAAAAPPRRPGRKPDPNVMDFVIRFREKTGRVPSGSEIKAGIPGIATSTAYDYAKRARFLSPAAQRR